MQGCGIRRGICGIQPVPESDRRRTECRDRCDQRPVIYEYSGVHACLSSAAVVIGAGVWNGTPHEFLIRAAELTRNRIGLPAYYNDEVIIPSLISRGLTLEDARLQYHRLREPQKAGKTEGWHDAAFFNMRRPVELVFSNGKTKALRSDLRPDVEKMETFEEFFHAYEDPDGLCDPTACQCRQCDRHGACGAVSASVLVIDGG